MNAYAIPGLKERPKMNKRAIHAREIIERTAEQFGIQTADMYRVTRLRKYLLPRQVAIYLIRRHTIMSLKDIGELFAANRPKGLDYTTVIYTLTLIANLVKQDERLSLLISEIENKLNSNIY
jgi:chromosomal replication initiator protein